MSPSLSSTAFFTNRVVVPLISPVQTFANGHLRFHFATKSSPLCKGGGRASSLTPCVVGILANRVALRRRAQVLPST